MCLKLKKIIERYTDYKNHLQELEIDTSVHLDDLKELKLLPKLRRLILLRNSKTKSLEGIQYCKNLEFLDLDRCDITDISLIEHCTKLKVLR